MHQLLTFLIEHDKHILTSIQNNLIRKIRHLFILRFKYDPDTFSNIQLFLPVLLIIVNETGRLYEACDAFKYSPI